MTSINFGQISLGNYYPYIKKQDQFIRAILEVIGASLSEPYINGTAMRAIYGICMYVYMYGTSVIRAPLHKLCTGPHAIFVLKSLRSKTTATACSNLVHLCNISLVVSCLRIKD